MSTERSSLTQLAGVVKPRTLKWCWALLAVCAAALPYARAFSGTAVFYIRDLSLFFWGRYLWFRRALWSGEWPLWDPYVGGGQAAVPDALHQMFLLPTVVLRLIGSEVLGFNLWVAVPFPLAALGSWLFFARRFSPSAAALGAMAYAICGPIVATGNFPNMSWSVALLPWTFWAVDRIPAALQPRPLGVLALIVALQAFAGEPVTLFTTLAAAVLFALTVDAPQSDEGFRLRMRRVSWVCVGIGIGVALAAVQILPMMQAAAQSERAVSIKRDFWSLHPLALIEAVSLHLFGDYYKAWSLSMVPWMPLINSGRESFFVSLYFGVPLLALAASGLFSAGSKQWMRFWLAAGIAGLIGALGSYTPLYPAVRDHLPLVGSFRFPAKYFVLTAMAIAAAAAASWNVLVSEHEHAAEGRRPWVLVGAGAAVVIGVLAYVAAAAAMYFPRSTAWVLFDLVRSLGGRDYVGAGEFMLKTLPRAATWLALSSFAAAALLFFAARHGARAVAVRWALYVFIVGDLLVHAWGVNPVFDPVHLQEPAWMSYMAPDSNWRFYVGGKFDGTLDTSDPDSSRHYLNPPGLMGSASRAALSNQAAFYPSAWRHREMLSYDLPVLWPKEFELATSRFETADRDERNRFLNRTAVRYRILPPSSTPGRTPLTRIPLFQDGFLFDWGNEVMPRVSMVPNVQVVPDVREQIEALFQPGWNSASTALVTRIPAPAGEAGPPVPPSAEIASESSNTVVVDAGAGPDGGYLVLLDSYSDDWQVTVDGDPADLVRANGLFRAVRLVPGRHRVEFVFRPRAFFLGAGISGIALLGTMALLVATPEMLRRMIPMRPREVPPQHAVAAGTISQTSE